MANIVKGAQSNKSAWPEDAAFAPAPGTAKKPTAVFILMLAGGVIILLTAIGLLAIETAAISYINQLNANALTANTGIAINSTIRTQISSSAGGVYASSSIGIVAGLILIVLSLMVRKSTDMKKIHNLSIAALVVSILSYFGGGGIFIGMALGIIGAVLGMIYKG